MVTVPGVWAGAGCWTPTRSWIFPRDPDFAAKAGRVLDLYARRWDNKPLKPDEYVISTDEKTSIQARCRCHPTLPPGPHQPMRVEHEYQRRGALQYFAALDVHHAKVIGRCEDTTGIVPFSRLVEQIMTTEPYASARRVFFVADRLLAFERYWQATGTPFDWKFTRTDLNDLLARIDTHESLAAAA